jgi:hypothetical protein
MDKKKDNRLELPVEKDNPLGLLNANKEKNAVLIVKPKSSNKWSWIKRFLVAGFFGGTFLSNTVGAFATVVECGLRLAMSYKAASSFILFRWFNTPVIPIIRGGAMAIMEPPASDQARDDAAGALIPVNHVFNMNTVRVQTIMINLPELELTPCSIVTMCQMLAPMVQGVEQNYAIQVTPRIVRLPQSLIGETQHFWHGRPITSENIAICTRIIHNWLSNIEMGDEHDVASAVYQGVLHSAVYKYDEKMRSDVRFYETQLDLFRREVMIHTEQYCLFRRKLSYVLLGLPFPGESLWTVCRTLTRYMCMSRFNLVSEAVKISLTLGIDLCKCICLISYLFQTE